EVGEDLRPVLERERAMGHGPCRLRRGPASGVAAIGRRCRVRSRCREGRRRERASTPGAAKVKGQVVQRHTRRFAYRCYLPVLTGFTSPGCAGPGPNLREW